MIYESHIVQDVHGTNVFVLNPNSDADWQPLESGGELPAGITRLAVSADGTWLALVAAE